MPHGHQEQNVKEKEHGNKFNKVFKNSPHQKKKKKEILKAKSQKQDSSSTTAKSPQVSKY